MPDKVLIINFHSGKNAGDLALLLTTVDILNKAFGKPKIKVSANWVDEPYYRQYGVEVVPSFRSILESASPASAIFQILTFIFLCLRVLFSRSLSAGFRKRAVKNDFDQLMAAFEVSDLIVAVSGNQVYSSGKFGWPLPVTLAPLFLAKHFGKPLVVFPQSIGPLKRKWERKMVKRAYEYASKVFVRDDKSLALLKELGFPKEKYAYAPDPAFGLRAAPADAALQILSEAGMADDKFRIGLTVISRMGKALDQDNISRYYQILENGLAGYQSGKTVQIVLFTQVWGPSELENDSIPTRELAARLKARGLDVVLVDKELDPILLKACYGQMDIFIASRLHSGIFAFGQGTPTLFLGYLTKTEGLTKRLEMSEYFIDINEIIESDFTGKIRLLEKNNKEIREKITRINQNFRQDLTKVEDYLKRKP